MFASNTSQVSSEAVFIEDTFSTTLYTGNGSTQTITNGIDLAGEGGLVWLKSRSAAGSNWLTDTARGVGNELRTNTTNAQGAFGFLSAFNSNGFTDAGQFSGASVASWTFRKQPKFFDVVTYTGDGAFTQLINHSLGSVPGAMFIKRTDSTSDWFVYHRNVGNDKRLLLNGTAASATSPFLQYETPTSTQFTVGWESGVANVNESGATYVAYIFAHNAGGFGEDGTDNVISCGSFTTDGSNQATVELGYEPQWIITKRVNSTSQWNIIDNMRSWNVGGTDNYLFANLSNAEVTFNLGNPTATGFFVDGYPTDTYIYIAIRRGPMKTPTSGTEVFAPVARTGAGGSTVNISTGFPPDIAFNLQRTVTTGEPRVLFGGKLLGGGRFETNSTNGFNDTGYPSTYDVVEYGQTSLTLGTNWVTSGRTYVNHILRRAPSFFDEVCYTGTGSARTVAHNLGVAPELMIVKARQTVAGYDQDWLVYQKDRGHLKYLVLNIADAEQTGYSTNPWTAAPSSSSFSVGSWEAVNFSGYNYVAYLFASCPGVSKVTNFTGTGALQTINCGFAGGARFVLIKRTDSTGDWYVWDSSRGLSSSNDPYLLLNSTAAEVTSTNWVDTTSTGFQVTAAAGNNVNINGASYIALAIA